MMGKNTEWLIRISGSALLLYAFYKLYSRPLTHSYHDAFLFLHLQLVLWFMLLLIMLLVSNSFSDKRSRWLAGILTFILLAPYPWVHVQCSERAEMYFFEQRYVYFIAFSQQNKGQSTDLETLYNQLEAIDVRDYEQGENYIAYWVDRMPEQRDGFIYMKDGSLPDRLFGYPVKHTKQIGEKWFSFSSN